jgi:hypothetical protein
MAKSTTKNAVVKKTAVKKTRTQESVENGIKILKTAIKSEISLSEASRRNSFGRNYLSDVKIRIKDNLKKKNVDKQTYQEFSTLLKTYNSL